jgi:rare lipoprotein A
MRNIALAGLAALTLGLVQAQPAAAWNCSGPEVACSSAGTAKKATKAKYSKAAKHNRVARAGKTQRHASQKSRKYASRKATYSGSYGGGSTGIASYYSSGTRTASGARFNPGGMTAAHRTLPFGTRVLVTSAATGRSVTVTINDRGPFVKGRIIDLSRGAAQALGITGSGLARVSVSVVGG